MNLLKTLCELEKAATGPVWDYYNRHPDVNDPSLVYSELMTLKKDDTNPGHIMACGEENYSVITLRADMELICALRNAAPALLESLEIAMRALEKLPAIALDHEYTLDHNSHQPWAPEANLWLRLKIKSGEAIAEIKGLLGEEEK